MVTRLPSLVAILLITVDVCALRCAVAQDIALPDPPKIELVYPLPSYPLSVLGAKELSLEQMQRIDKRMRGSGRGATISCGVLLDRDGRLRGCKSLTYWSDVPGEVHDAVSFYTYDGRPEVLYKVSGPGFRYLLREGKFVREDFNDRPQK